MCWRPASQSVDAFIGSGVADASKLFMSGKSIRVYVPIGRSHYAVKTFRSTASLTLSRILRHVEAALFAAVAYHVRTDMGRSSCTVREARSVLRDVSICGLLLRRTGAHNYVYLQFDGELRPVI